MLGRRRNPRYKNSAATWLGAGAPAAERPREFGAAPDFALGFLLT